MKTLPPQQVGILVEGGGDGLQEMPLEVAVTADTGVDDTVEDLTCHASETDLEAMLLHFHVDKNGRQ